ncbi:MAG: site-specific DNA-methyltransferase [Candidatus Sungbacteria bacterium]|nr:site-specific DNA-methyltransferase [Candidatus Sungbacteria bacterium]
MKAIHHHTIIHEDCLKYLSGKKSGASVDLTFLDPPFNQDKEYSSWNDNLPEDTYWQMMKDVCRGVFEITSDGGALYFMQREKNVKFVLQCLYETGWSFQNLIIWKKKTSAVPCSNKFGKHYQIIAFATKGKKSRVFNRLRISPPLPPNYKYERENGIYLTDIWDDIRELTAGYFAGEEAIKKENGERFHKQQSPLALLVRIILSSTKIGDTVLDPFAGTGTALVAARQMGRKSIGVEIDPDNIKGIRSRMEKISQADNVMKFYKEYGYTENLKEIWSVNPSYALPDKKKQPSLSFTL